MSIIVSKEIWSRSLPKSGSLIVLLAIADNANDDGRAYPGLDYLADKTRMSRRNVQRCIRQLELAGHLRCERGAGPRGCTVYHVLPDAFPRKDEGAAKSRPTPPMIGGRDTHDAAGVTPATREGDAHATQTVIEPSGEPNPSIPLKGEERILFDTLFDCLEQSPYPLKPRAMRDLLKHAPAFDKPTASALVRFYHAEPIGCKEAPYSSRKHSVERLLRDLPRQIAKATKHFPPPAELPPPPEGWEQARDALYPDATEDARAASFHGMPDYIRREIREWLAKRAAPADPNGPAPI